MNDRSKVEQEPGVPIVDYSTGQISYANTEGLPDLANETLGEVSFPLAARFSFRGVAYESLRLRVPNGRDLREWLELPEAERTPHAWAAIIIDAPREILDVMYAGDYAELLSTASRLAGRTLGQDKG